MTNREWKFGSVSALLGLVFGAGGVWTFAHKVLANAIEASDVRLQNDARDRVFALRDLREGHPDRAMTRLEAQIDEDVLGLAEMVKDDDLLRPGVIDAMRWDRESRIASGYSPDGELKDGVNRAFDLVLSSKPQKPAT